MSEAEAGHAHLVDLLAELGVGRGWPGRALKALESLAGAWVGSPAKRRRLPSRAGQLRFGMKGEP
jgi:hypothetical protein